VNHPCGKDLRTILKLRVLAFVHDKKIPYFKDRSLTSNLF